MKIVGGTQNKAKLMAISAGVRAELPRGPLEVEGADVDSGVSNQPMNLDEMYEGAVNRANRAAEVITDADLYFGLEGGIEKVGQGYVNFGLVYVLGKSGVTGLGVSQGVAIPDVLAEKIHEGKELSEAVAEEYGTDTLNDRDCTGVITNGHLNVELYYTQAVQLAMIDYLLNERIALHK
jgi:inosine/xanthosine triphosphatase